MKYRCIIFDCDGVLVDSEGISIRVLIEMANTIGATIDTDYAHEHFTGNSLMRVLEIIEEQLGFPLPDTFEKEYRERSFQAFKTEMQPIKGVHELLEKITIPYCVASSGPMNKIKLNLTTTGLIDKFENRMFSCYDIGMWKPDPAIFLHAAKSMGFVPGECAVIEDSLPGIRAAKNGGFDVFGFARPKNQKAFELEGAKVFFEMKELGELLLPEFP